MAATTTTTTTTARRGLNKPLAIAAFLTFVASLFYWISAFSVPYAKSIYYVRTTIPAGWVKLGNFGWCGQDPITGVERCYRHVGYRWGRWIIQEDRLTRGLILVALTAAFGSLAFFSLLHSMRNARSGFLSFILTLLTFLMATLSFFFVVVMFAVAHSRFADDNLRPKYGAAFILVILGWLLYLAALPLVIIGWFRQRRHRDETVVHASNDRVARRGFFKR